MNKFFLVVFFWLFLTSCFKNKTTFNENENIQNLGTPVKIEYFKNKPGRAFQDSDTASFVITDQQELNSIMEEIANADDPEPWKGAGWDRLRISYTDTVLNINTNIKRIGLSSSGMFYDLGKENFITNRIR